MVPVSSINAASFSPERLSGTQWRDPKLGTFAHLALVPGTF